MNVTLSISKTQYLRGDSRAGKSGLRWRVGSRAAARRARNDSEKNEKKDTTTKSLILAQDER